MSKTLFGTYLMGYELSAASQGTLNTVTVTGSIDLGAATLPGALYGQGPASWTVTNQGTITGDKGAGVDFAAGGSILNSRFLSGHFGVAIQTNSGVVTNTGTIIAVNAGTAGTAQQAIGVMLAAGGSVNNQIGGQITGQGAGIEIVGNAGTVLNAGTINGPSYEGIYLASGSVTNQNGGVITGGTIGSGGSIGTGGSLVNSGWGVVIRNGGSLSNAGNITGIGQGGVLMGSGYAGNQGTINGVWGVAINGGLGTVINSGLLVGTSAAGAYLTGGSVTNTSLGRIVGVTGVFIHNGAGTVVNGGSIIATSPGGYSVYLGGGFTNRLIANPGAGFSGPVNGGNTIGAAATSTLELTAGGQQGTLSGLGSQFINFAQTTIDPGASWALTGANTLAPGASLTNSGSLTVDGALWSRGSLISAGPMTIGSSSGVVASATVTAGGSWTSGLTLVVGDSGGGSLLIANNGGVREGAAVLGASGGGTGTVDVAGPAAALSIGGLLTIGNAGRGHLTVENNGTALTGDVASASAGLDIGQAASGAGDVLVTGAGSLLRNNGRFVVGNSGPGQLSIEAGGGVVTSSGGVAGLAGMVIGNAAGASGSAANVIGSGSSLGVTGTLIVGAAGFGSLSVSQGAVVTAASIDEASASGGDGVISVTGTGSALTLSGSLTVGDQAAGEVSILNGATVSALDVTIGNASPQSSGNVDIEGNGSSLLIGAGGVLNVGVAGGGSGVLTIGVGTTLTSAAGIVEAGHASFNNNGGVVDPPFVDFTGPSNAGLGFNSYDLYVENIGAVQIIGGTGTWDTPMMLTGTSVADANNNINNLGDSGAWQLSSSGTLIVNANTVDAGQAIVFEDSTDTLVIGQIVNNGSPGVSGTAPVVTPGAENVLQAGGWAAEIWGYVTGDKIQFDNMTVSSALVTNGNTVDLYGPGAVLLGSLSFFNKAGSKASPTGAAAAALQMVVPCFAAGTRIGTADGWARVEDLAVGDRVLTREGAAESVVWIGQRTVNCDAHPRPEAVWPVRVAAGAFGALGPVRDLYLSPDHAVFVNDVLVPVKLLINGASIVQVKRPTVTYYHIELSRHEVILAEGLTVESYLDTGDRMDFRGGAGAITLFPDFSARLAPDAATLWETHGAAPLVMSGDKLAAARRLVAEGPAYGRASFL